MATQTTVVVAQPALFGEAPCQTTCPNCRNTIVTTVQRESGVCTWIAVVVVLLVCCPCFFIPLVIDTCKDSRHMCPSCNATVGISKKI
ncbi:lipopolysaccharide-induced tumor necrosis factor-alpha factor homolog [Tachypleus tridentatus]|uniref:lipopolysaccharide-induced tumor necrosis factor-alpha factor homolog n=1 Tax=Tachypleus tridentatus TaxID=6853 RepID=UPI003FD51F9B